MIISIAMVLFVLLALSIQSSGGPRTAVLDAKWIVEDNFLRPLGQLRSFEPEVILNEYLVQSREVFPSQNFYGSVVLGGANVVIPRDTVWQNSVITRVK
jgi:hypothetical protein